MYKHSIEAHLRNHCCCRKVLNISYSEHVSVALGTQDAKCMHSTAICGLSGSTIFFHIILHRHIKKKTYWTL